MTIGIDHDHPAHLALADVDASRPKGEKTLDLCLLITAERWSDVEVQPVLAGLRCQRRPTPGELRSIIVTLVEPDGLPSRRSLKASG